MSIAGTYTESPTIFLRPRPLARTPGSFVLLPLLPQPRPLKPLPTEVWSQVLSHVVNDHEDGHLSVLERRALLRKKWKLLFVCKSWLNVALPLLYSRVHIFTVGNLQRFAAHLVSSDQRWDSIRRIPYSTPGRWVQTLDLSEILLANSTELLTVDSSFTRLWPLLPFLTSLYLIPDMPLSNRALSALACKEGISELRSLKGLKVPAPAEHASTQAFGPIPDAVTELLRNCPLLESLEIAYADAVSPDLESLDDLDLDLGPLRDEAEAAVLPPPLHLPNLKSLSLFMVPICPLFLTLLRTPLPELRHLLVTPYSGRHTAQLTAQLTAHGRGLISLRINTPRHLFTSTGDVPRPPVLVFCPELQYLALDQPLPVLLAPSTPAPTPSHDDVGGSPSSYSLRVLTIPRPNARFLREVEALLPRLPSLGIVRVRSVRWLRAGVSRKALETGVQGEMREWRHRLARKGVRLVDGEWRDPE